MTTPYHRHYGPQPSAPGGTTPHATGVRSAAVRRRQNQPNAALSAVVSTVSQFPTRNVT